MFVRQSVSLTSSLAQAAKSSLRSNAPVRSYASQPDAKKSSALPIILTLGGLAGVGYWYSAGGLTAGQVQKKGEQALGEAKAAVSGGALDKNSFNEFTLKQITPYNHDSATYVFELPDGKLPGMDVASAVVFKGVGEGVKDDAGKVVIRPYTPVSSPDTAGHIDFLIKKYDGGKMTGHLSSLKPGDKLGIKGPIPKFPYKANEFEHIGLIAGGSGITPMWQIAQRIASDPSDKTKVTLIYTNKTEKDILLREEWDKLAKDDRFTIVYGVDKASKGFQGFEGYATHGLLGHHLPLPGLAGKAKVFVCGPPGQVEAISGGKGPKGSQGELKGLLADLGFQPDQVYKF